MFLVVVAAAAAGPAVQLFVHVSHDFDKAITTEKVQKLSRMMKKRHDGPTIHVLVSFQILLFPCSPSNVKLVLTAKFVEEELKMLDGDDDDDGEEEEEEEEVVEGREEVKAPTLAFPKTFFFFVFSCEDAFARNFVSD